MTPEQTIEQAHKAEQALEFLNPAFDRLKADYMASMQKVAAVVPLKVETIQALAQAVRIVDVVKEQIEAFMVEGELAKADVEHGRKLVDMSAADRQLLNIAASRRHV